MSRIGMRFASYFLLACRDLLFNKGIYKIIEHVCV
jgi:hypothetical protein